jgi:hypothetical protein
MLPRPRSISEGHCSTSATEWSRVDDEPRRPVAYPPLQPLQRCGLRWLAVFWYREQSHSSTTVTVRNDATVTRRTPLPCRYWTRPAQCAPLPELDSARSHNCESTFWVGMRTASPRMSGAPPGVPAPLDTLAIAAELPRPTEGSFPPRSPTPLSKHGPVGMKRECGPQE